MRAGRAGNAHLIEAAARTGAAFVLVSVVGASPGHPIGLFQAKFLPQELGFGSGMTAWRRLRDWQEAGVCQQLHEVLLAELKLHLRYLQR